MKEVKVLAIVGDEVVARAGPEDLYKRTFDASGNAIGKIVKVLGPVEAPYGVVKMKSRPQEGVKMYLKE